MIQGLHRQNRRNVHSDQLRNLISHAEDRRHDMSLGTSEMEAAASQGGRACGQGCGGLRIRMWRMLRVVMVVVVFVVVMGMGVVAWLRCANELGEGGADVSREVLWCWHGFVTRSSVLRMVLRLLLRVVGAARGVS